MHSSVRAETSPSNRRERGRKKSNHAGKMQNMAHFLQAVILICFPDNCFPFLAGVGFSFERSKRNEYSDEMEMKRMAEQQQGKKMNMGAIAIVLIIAAVGIYMFISTMK